MSVARRKKYLFNDVAYLTSLFFCLGDTQKVMLECYKCSSYISLHVFCFAYYAEIIKFLIVYLQRTEVESSHHQQQHLLSFYNVVGQSGWQSSGNQLSWVQFRQLCANKNRKQKKTTGMFGIWRRQVEKKKNINIA